MDVGGAIVAVAVGALALLPRIPALSTDGRRVARLRSDAELVAALPEGAGREALSARLDAEVLKLVDQRSRPIGLEQGLYIAMVWFFLAWTAGLAADMIPSDAKWFAGFIGPLRLAAVLLAAFGGLVLGLLMLRMAVEAYRAAVGQAKRLRGWLARRSQPARAR